MNIRGGFEFEAEAARQFALERYDILDTTEEYCFDHITRAVKLALEVPMAAISLMDGKRLWFKSKTGFDVPEVPRYTALCNHTIGQNGSMIIEDTTRDPRIANSPSVSGVLSLKSYIGVPLTTPDGHNIGALCAGDIVPRKFGHSKIELMEQLAELVIHELELRQRADKDRLTGALTRSGFSVEVQKAISLYDRRNIKSTLVLLDFDLCKMEPRSFSGRSGNTLLRGVIQSLIARLDSSSCIGRMGGTQFAVLLTATTKAEAMLVAEDILGRMELMNTGAYFDLSFSEISSEIGICDDWLKQANADLVAARQSDRSVSRLKSDKCLNWAY